MTNRTLATLLTTSVSRAGINITPHGGVVSGQSQAPMRISLRTLRHVAESFVEQNDGSVDVVVSLTEDQLD